MKIGYRKITVKSDVLCKCRECKDIKSYRECVNTHPCPNNGGQYSYCFWKRPYTPHNQYDDKKNPNVYTPYDDKKNPNVYTPYDDKKNPNVYTPYDDKKNPYEDTKDEKKK